MRRAKPSLGTLVVIEAPDLDEALFAGASDAAFARIASVHAVMSFHEADSDLRALARAAGGAVLRVHGDTHAVLRLALQLEAESGGAFNACCAATLVARGLLPPPHDARPARAASLCEGIELLDDDCVRVLRTPWIDFGGVAKGYAVDAAVEALQHCGVRDGIVNAGGDLRAFGEARSVVHVRDPRSPALAMPVAELSSMACATSAWSLSTHDGAHLIGGHAALADNAPMSVTVFAPSCAIADALTKVVWQRAEACADLLGAHAARSFVLRADGSTLRL
jgi:thiamine biosynthesis lipoprotein